MKSINPSLIDEEFNMLENIDYKIALNSKEEMKRY